MSILSDEPSLAHVEVVLQVTNLEETIRYWQSVLGFTDKWMYGDPPYHGGVSWNGTAFIQFSQNAERAEATKGTCLWIRTRRVHKLYERHSGIAEVVAPLESKPWGMDEYIIRDINGHYVIFSEPTTHAQVGSSASIAFEIEDRKPTTEEHIRITHAVGWEWRSKDAYLERLLNAAAFGCVAVDQSKREVIGTTLVLSDGVGIYHIKDVAVSPEWQGKGVGTALMWRATDWINANAPAGATVGLFTGDKLANFYSQFGFVSATGMYRIAGKKTES